jgi:hypothetical protein
MNQPPVYGPWGLAIVNSAVFILFAFWRSFGAFSAFLVAVLAEICGFPLTIYLLSGWLSRRNSASTFRFQPHVLLEEARVCSQ